MQRKNLGLTKVGPDYVFPKEILQQQFQELKSEAHKYNLKFYVGENRLRTLGDEMCCCGIEGLEGFEANTYNLCHIINKKDYKITEKMKEIGTAGCFTALHQRTLEAENIKNQSFADTMKAEYINKRKVFNEIFGKE